MIANHPATVAYVEQKTGVQFQPPYTSMGFVKDGNIVAGVVFHRWTVCDVEMGVAMEPGGLSRSALKEIADYVFRRESKRRMTVITPNSHKAAKAAATRVGFKFESVLRDYFPDENGVMYRMTRHDCRWL